MKKIIITIALVAAAATTSMAQTSVGAGYINANSTSTVKVGDQSSTTESVSGGFYVGGDMTFDIQGGLSVVPGLYYGMLSKSGDGVNIGELAKGHGTTTSHYISVPVNVQYGLNLTYGLKAFVYAGPQFNLGLASKTVISTEVLGSTNKTEINHYGEDSDLERFNLALGGGVGLDIMDKVRIKLGYNFGLLDLNDTDSITQRTNNFHVGAAFLF